MFLYRRQGPKKRSKPGGPPHNNKPRGQGKSLPNSARDLLPLLQPATKALAQMLAGRAGASGQLGHARAMLAQAERMVSERSHNRLNPAEREEFFEQVARLKLTIADAESEAEADEVAAAAPPPPPSAPPVGQERLRAMALALASRDRPVAGPAVPAPAAEAPLPEEPAISRPGPAAESSTMPAELVAGSSGPETPRDRTRSTQLRLARPGDSSAPALAPAALPAPKRAPLVVPASARAVAREPAPAQLPAEHASAAPLPEPAPEPAGTLSTPAATEVAAAEPPPPAAPAKPSRPRAPRRPRVASAEQPDLSVDGAAAASNGGAPSDAAAVDVDGAIPRKRRSKRNGLPEGWIIDEEGFVVPAGD